MSTPQADTPLSVLPQPAQQDTPLSVTPLDMPGARNQMNAPVETMTAPKDMPVARPDQKVTEATPAKQADGDDLMAKYKGVQELARKFEQVAKDEHTDAERYRNLVQQISGKSGEVPPDPIAEIQRLRADWETERTERIRERVARETGVPPTQIQGTDEEAMKTSAQSALSWVQGLMQKASVPVVAPAETVNSSSRTDETGVKQIHTRDELRSMSSKEIMAAYEQGRLDHMIGKTP